MITVLQLLIFSFLLSGSAWAFDVTSACLGHWKLNDNAASQTTTDSCDSLGGSTFDSGGAINTSSITTTGKLSAGFSLDGSTHKRGVDILNHSALRFDKADAWSVEAWFKTSVSGEMDILSNFDEANVIGWAVELSSGKIQVIISNTVTTNWIQQLSTGTYNDNAFHHIVVTKSTATTASGLTFYIDGSAVTKAAPAGDNLSSAITYTNAIPAIGLRNNISTGTGAWFSGTLDEVVVYNRALTAGEVSGRYNSGAGTENLSTAGSNNVMFMDVF